MRQLLFSCDSYANEFDIIFNASKSKFLVCIPGKLRNMFNNLNLNGCLFYIGVRPIENVISYSHLGTLLIVIVMIKMMFCKEDVILRFKQTMFFVFSRHWICILKYNYSSFIAVAFMEVSFGRVKMMFFKTFVVRGEQLSGVY